MGKEISQSGFVFNYGHSTSLCRFHEILNAFSLDKSLKPYGSLGYVEQIRPDEVLFIYLFQSGKMLCEGAFYKLRLEIQGEIIL